MLRATPPKPFMNPLAVTVQSNILADAVYKVKGPMHLRNVDSKITILQKGVIH
jgi:hypothetical protein